MANHGLSLLFKNFAPITIQWQIKPWKRANMVCSEFEPGPQDGGRIRIHCAGFSLFLVIQVSISCICKSLYLLFSAFYYFLALNYLSFPLRQAFPIRFTFCSFCTFICTSDIHSSFYVFLLLFLTIFQCYAFLARCFPFMKYASTF